MSQDTIRMEPYDNETEWTAISVFTGEQWEQIGPPYETIHDALKGMDSLRKWLHRECGLATKSALDAALNSGDGAYRP